MKIKSVMRVAVIPILAASIVVAGACHADDSSGKEPKAPDGWKYVTGKDGTYQFLFPEKTTSSGARSQSSNEGGLASKAQINYCELADGMALLISVEKLSGPALKKLKISEVYQLVVEGIKQKGYSVSEPKDFVLAKQKAREYFLSKDQIVQRKILLILRDGRVFDLTVVGGDRAKVTSPMADTFLKSLVLVAKAAPSKEAARETAGDALPATPAPTSRQKLPATAAYRPTFKSAGGKEESAGTAFVIKAPSGKKLAVTAAHVLDPKEWAALQSVTLTTMAGKKVIDLAGKPAYVGRGFDELPELRKGPVPIFNTSEDFALWVAPDGAEVTVLELADHEPKVNEWVWIAGQQPGKPLLFYRSKVTQVLGGTMIMEQHDRFNPQGFSGAPVLTADGKVIGTMLAGDPKGNMRQGATLANIRTRIEGR
jgi:hypothetical protein